MDDSVVHAQPRRQDLAEFLRAHGIARVSTAQRKPQLVAAYVARVEESMRVVGGDDAYDDGSDIGKRSLAVVDVGTMNLAWVEVVVGKDSVARETPATALCDHRVSIERGALINLFKGTSAEGAAASATAAATSTSPSASNATLDTTAPRNMAKFYAERVRQLLIDAQLLRLSPSLAATTGAPWVTVELQMQRHNPRCIMVETLLHAFLHPRTMSFSPLSVAVYYDMLGGIGATAKARRTEPSDATTTSPKLNESTTTPRKLPASTKKYMAVQLVRHWLDTNRIIDMGGDNDDRSGSGSRLAALFRESKKRDDIADCVLAGMFKGE